MTRRRVALSIALLIVAGAGVILYSYAAGRRAGRGAMCFEVAIHSRDNLGRSLASELLAQPGARSDYTFWGTQCTVSVGFLRGGQLVGGRWRYDPSRDALWADSAEAEALFPAAGRWQPSTVP